jgi:phage gp29-like protein
MGIREELKHQITRVGNAGTAAFERFFSTSEVSDGEIVRVPDYEIQKGNAFLRTPDMGFRITQESLQGLFLVHDNEVKDPHFASQIESRKNALLSQPWDIIPGDDSPLAEEIADFVRWNMNNIDGTIIGTFDAALDAISKGFSISEKVWEYIPRGEWAGKYRIKAIKDKDQRYFRFKIDPYGNLTQDGVQYVDKWGTYLGAFDPAKFFIFVFQKRRDDWYGRGLGAGVAWYLFFKKNLVRSRNVYMQKFGNPTVVGRHPPGQATARITEFLDAVKNLTEQSSIVFPDGPEGQQFSIELLEAQRSGDAGYQQFLEYIDQAVSKRITGGTLTADPGTRGARSLGNIHNSNRILLATFDAYQLQDSFNEQVINHSVELNYGIDAPKPKLEFRLLSPLTRKELLENFVLAQQLGMDLPKDWVYNELQFMKPDGDEDVLEPKENVRLGHRGGNDTMPENRNGDGNKETMTERFADLNGISTIWEKLQSTAIINGVHAMETVRDSAFKSVKGRVSRSQRFSVKGEKISINVKPLRDIIVEAQCSAWAWGAKTGTENLQRLGITELNPQVTDPFKPSMFSDHPKQVKILSELPLDNSEITSSFADIRSNSYVLAGIIQKSLDDKLHTLLDSERRFTDEVDVSLNNLFIPYTGTTRYSELHFGDPVDAPDLASFLFPIVRRAFNNGRLAVFKENSAELGGLMFCSELGGDQTPVAKLNSGNTYAVHDKRWDWLLPPTHELDRGTIIPIKDSKTHDDPPVPDVQPEELTFAGVM